jgi:hypothetical protein
MGSGLHFGMVTPWPALPQRQAHLALAVGYLSSHTWNMPGRWKRTGLTSCRHSVTKSGR